MAASSMDAESEALIAKIMAEDFGEVYEDYNRPIGSDWRDYEEPLTSYERQCLDNPDMEDGEGGWNPPTPKFDPIEILAEGETWDSSVNEDWQIDSIPIRSKVDVDDSNDGAKNVESEADKDNAKDEGGASVKDASHHLHDPIDYHSLDNLTVQSPRHTSQPVHELESPTIEPRRNITDPPQLETTVNINTNYPPGMEWSRAQSPIPPEPVSPVTQPRREASPKLSTFFAPTIATNEALLDLNSPVPLLLDTSLSKKKGKEPADLSSTDDGFERTHSSKKTKTRRNKRPAPSSWSSDDPDTTPNKKGKGKDKGKSKAKSESKSKSRHPPRDEVPSDLDDDDGDDSDLSYDNKNRIPLLRVPWPGSGPGERAFQDAMERIVAEVRVGEEESVDSILLGIMEREEVRRKDEEIGIGTGVEASI